MAEPAEDDVERLAEWAHLPGVTNVSEDRQVALNLLRHDVTLPPEPDTPPEPQERWYAEAGNYTSHFYVVDRSGGTDSLRTDDSETATRIARLLNLDESVKDDDCSGLHEAYPALVEQLAEARAHLQAIQVQGPYEVGHEHGQIGAVATVNQARRERNEARAEVERLTAELAEAVEDGRHWHEQVMTAVPQDDGPTEPPHEFQGHPGDVCTSCDCQMETGNHLRPAEPLFTGKVQRRRSLMGMKHLDWVQITPAYREDFPFDRLDIDDLVDVYPHGQRPAAPALPPADMMIGDRLSALANLPENWDSYGAKPITTKAIAAARSLHFTPVADGGIQIELHRNGRVAEIRVMPDGALEPEDSAAPAQAVTAEMVRRVLGESGALAVAADQGLSPFDVADRLNGLLGRTPHRPEDR